MSRLLGKLSLGLSLSYHSDTFVYPATLETYVTAASGGISTLPSASPATSQVIYTMSAGTMVACSNSASTMQQNPWLGVIGINNSASATTVYFKPLLNGASAGAQVSVAVPAGRYFAADSYQYLNAKEGDTCEIKMYAPSASVLLLEQALIPGFSRYLPMGKAGRLILLAKAPSITIPYALTSAIVCGNGGGKWWIPIDDNNVNANHIVQAIGVETYSWAARSAASNSFLICGYGDKVLTMDTGQAAATSGIILYYPQQFTSAINYYSTDYFP